MKTPPGKVAAEIAPNGLALNLAAVPLVGIVVAGLVFAAMNLPHRISPSASEGLLGLTGIAVLLVVHELIHGLVLVTKGRIPWRALKFGFNWKYFAFFCHSCEAVPLRVLRQCALAPLLTLGPLTVLATLLYPAIWLAVATGIHLSGCIGDIWLCWVSRRYPDHFLYLDHPNRLGGTILEPDNQNSGSITL